jgi:AcrR family transcriptional regulator
MASDATRDSLLDAAKRVMQRNGAGHLTLDAVAREAGVSKGGLLYHIPNKQALLRGVVEYGGQCMRQDMEEQIGLMKGPRSFARAYLQLSIYGPPDNDCRPSSEAIWALLGAAANDPSLLTPIQETQAELGRRLDAEALDPDVANLIRLIGRGLWMTEIFGFEPPTDLERRRLHDLIARLGDLPAQDDTTHRDLEDI